MSSLKITLKKSLIGFEKSQGLTARALGLGKVGRTMIHPDNGAIRGMIKKLNHVVEVEETDETPTKTARSRKSAGTGSEQAADA